MSVIAIKQNKEAPTTTGGKGKQLRMRKENNSRRKRKRQTQQIYICAHIRSNIGGRNVSRVDLKLNCMSIIVTHYDQEMQPCLKCEDGGSGGGISSLR